jgi:hypothetical protein
VRPKPFIFRTICFDARSEPADSVPGWMVLKRLLRGRVFIQELGVIEGDADEDEHEPGSRHCIGFRECGFGAGEEERSPRVQRRPSASVHAARAAAF